MTMPFLTRGLFVSAACAGLLACAGPGMREPTPVAAVTPTPAGSAMMAGATQVGSPPVTSAKPRVCSARGQSANAGFSEPWSITVSNEGLPCGHVRALGSNNTVYEILKPPQHGQIGQQSDGPRTRVTYTPTAGYKGSDSFSLRYSGRNIEMPYLVNVIP